MSAKSPLGRRSSYLASYSPDLLHTIPRDENRRLLGLTAELPFHGEDVWNAYELAWLDSDGKPRVAMAEIRVQEVRRVRRLLGGPLAKWRSAAHPFSLLIQSVCKWFN